MMTGDSHRDKTKNDNCKAEGGKFQNCSNGFHLSNGLTARGELCIGLTVLVEGRAKSPVLNASAVAVVKIAACVS
jgi:hypothetical protein